MKRQIISIVVIVACLALCATAHANELLVPAEYPTIQAAIDDCNDGDEVIVADGTYTGDGNRDIDFGGSRGSKKGQRVLAEISEYDPANAR